MFKSWAGKYFSVALFIFAAMVLTASAETTNNVPFSDDFEGYTNDTPLIDGINGWYASSNSVVVQQNVVYSGTKAAMIPPDSTLSNRFVQTVNSNILVSMWVRPTLDDASCVADSFLTTNSTAVFYINTNGFCVVYDGTNGWTELTTNQIDGSAAPQIGSNEWSKFDLRIDHGSRVWALAVSNEILSTNLAFATNSSYFSGFDIYNLGAEQQTNYASSTNYLNNVSVSYFPALAIDITNISRTIFAGQNVPSNSFYVWNSSGNVAMPFTNSITYTNCDGYTNWLSVTPANDTSSGEQKTVWLVFNTTNLPASNQAYQATVQIDGTNEIFGMSANNSPQSITVSVLVGMSPSLWVAPLNLTNSVTVGHRASGQNIAVANTSAPPRTSMGYTVVPQTNWISVSPFSGSVVDETNDVAFTYLTENLPAGLHSGTVTVTSVGIATQNVVVVMQVNSAPVLSWNAGQQTNIITEGETISDYNFEVWNSSAAPTGTMNFTVSADAAWLSLSPVSGVSSGDHQAVSVIYSVTNLSPGVYTGTVICAGVDDSTGAAASNSPLTFVANLTVRERATLAIDIGSLSNSILENCEETTANAFNIWNGADTPRGGLIYSITSSDWLGVNPSGGTITDETNAITVVWTPGSRAPGTYSGSIIVDGTDELTSTRARGAPKTIAVQMTVLSRTPVNYEKPTIYGMPYIGQTLTARDGLWQNMDRLTFTYQWQRVNTILPGETMSNYVVVVADRGQYMRIAVTATDANPSPLSTTAYSDLVSAVKIKAVSGDFSGDGITDLWFFDPSTGMWRASFAANSFAEGQFGSAGMTDVPGDYNGDGILDLGLYDSAHGMWHILYLPSGPSLSGSMFGGLAEETQATPVPDDYDGDGQTDVALYWQGYWAILYSTLNQIVVISPIAGAGAVPAPGDYDGDGVTDLGVYDSGLWTIRNVLGEEWSVQFGSSAWIPAPGDYDGDNITDLGIFNQASNVWSMLYSTSGAITNTVFPSATRSFGTSLGANLPRQGYYDHDPYCDPATLHYSADGDFVIWCVTRTFYANVPYKGTNGQTYQKSINNWRVSW